LLDVNPLTISKCLLAKRPNQFLQMLANLVRTMDRCAFGQPDIDDKLIPIRQRKKIGTNRQRKRGEQKSIRKGGCDPFPLDGTQTKCDIAGWTLLFTQLFRISFLGWQPSACV
jgi:hypothetical protein